MLMPKKGPCYGTDLSINKLKLTSEAGLVLEGRQGLAEAGKALGALCR